MFLDWKVDEEFPYEVYFLALKNIFLEINNMYNVYTQIAKSRHSSHNIRINHNRVNKVLC